MAKWTKHGHRGMRGIGLLELLLALTVVAVISVAVVRYYQVTKNNHAVQQAMRSVHAIHLCALHHDVNSDDGTKDSNLVPLWVMRGQLPAGFSQQANPWGGQVRAVVVGRHVRIALDHVPLPSGTRLIANLNEPQTGAQAVFSNGTLLVNYDLLA